MIDIGQFTTELTTILLLCFMGFSLAMLITPLYTKYAYKYGWWKKKRTTSVTGEKLEVISKLSTRKRRVPTMAGIIIVLAVAIVTVIFNLSREQTWLPVAALVGGAIVGLLDDMINVRGSGLGVAGLRAPVKFGLISLVAGIGAWFFYFKLGYTSIHLPIVGEFELGLMLIPLFILAVVSTANAVNISDGLDGLAGGLLLSSYTTFGIIAFLQGNYGISGFCFTITGALLTYIWFNIPPARFFMGDVGSFAMGTSLGVVAMMTDTLFLLPIIGVVFVAEAGSTLLQIFSKKLFGKRIFIAAPLHHHLEASGWEKTKVTMRFWIIGIIFSLIGLLVAITGGY